MVIVIYVLGIVLFAFFLGLTKFGRTEIDVDICAILAVIWPISCMLMMIYGAYKLGIKVKTKKE